MQLSDSTYASNMILKLHSDASYLSAGQGRIRVGGYFFLDSIPRNDKDIQLNDNIHITCAILKLVAASAVEAELGALFLNAQEARVKYQVEHLWNGASSTAYTYPCGQHYNCRDSEQYHQA